MRKPLSKKFGKIVPLFYYILIVKLQASQIKREKAGHKVIQQSEYYLYVVLHIVLSILYA